MHSVSRNFKGELICDLKNFLVCFTLGRFAFVNGDYTIMKINVVYNSCFISKPA